MDAKTIKLEYGTDYESMCRQLIVELKGVQSQLKDVHFKMDRLQLANRELRKENAHLRKELKKDID